jgi:hypothetical protein
MKMQYTKEELIKWCQKIVEYNKWTVTPRITLVTT